MTNTGLVQQKEPAPPFFKFKKGLVALVDVAEKVGVLAEQGPRRVHLLKIVHQVRTVEYPAATMAPVDE